MSLFLAKRFATFVATLAGTTIITFLALEILPGDPARVILGVEAPDSAVQALREQLGLDRPALERYLEWVSSLATGSFANSYTYSVPVDELLAARLEITVPLALLAMALSVAMAMTLGIFAAARHNQRGDVVVMGVSQLGISVPNFWLALLLILLFAIHLRWFSAGGFPGWDAGVGPALKSLLLPALALATVQGAILTRFTRSAVLETMREDYVRTARAKGLTRGQTLRRHVLRNAMIPLVTVMGPAVRQPPRRHHRGRERIRPAWRRPADTPGDHQPRPLWWCATSSPCSRRWWCSSIWGSTCSTRPSTRA